MKDIHKQAEDMDELSRMLLTDQTLWLEGDILLGAGQAARAAGVELLMPYTDRRMLELAARIPAALKRPRGPGSGGWELLGEPVQWPAKS